MYFQTGLSPMDHNPPYGNVGLREESWSPGSYFVTPDSYQHLSTQGSPQVLEDTEYSTTFHDVNATQVYPHSFDIGGFAMHPTGGMVAVNRYGGTITAAYDPPSPQNVPNYSIPSRVVVPQELYICGNTQKKFDRRPSVPFSTNGRLGVKLLDAKRGEFKGIDGRDDPAFGANCRGVTIRIHFPGYPSSTEVEKQLKKRAAGDERSKARSMQLSAKNYRTNPDPVTISKLAQEVSKRIVWHVEDLEANSDLFPFDSQVGGKWRLNQGWMKFEHMVITGLDNVSSGSWSPVICIE